MTLRQKRRLANYLIVFLLLIVVALGYAIFGPGRRYLRAAALLQRISDSKGSSRLANYDRHIVDESATTVTTPNGPVPARLYTPRNVPNAPGMVVVHGVHHLGIQEPRLVAFARAIASSGVVVLTPELQDIADYRITPESVETIGASVNTLHDQLGEKVGLMGLSFSGGLSLLAAADPRFADQLSFVVSVGGHDDLARVCGFFASDSIPLPNGTIESLKAHEYGALVLVYSHPEDFFSPADLPAARDAIRLQLWEKMDQSEAAARRLSPEGHAKMDLLLAHKKEDLRPELQACVRRHASDMGIVSPHGNLAGLHVPVLLLHGVGDTVIPSSETLWLERDVPKQWLLASLITPVLSHVDIGKTAGVRAKLQLVRFMATMVKQADRSAREAQQNRQASQPHSSGAIHIVTAFPAPQMN